MSTTHFLEFHTTPIYVQPGQQAQVQLVSDRKGIIYSGELILLSGSRHTIPGTNRYCTHDNSRHCQNDPNSCLPAKCTEFDIEIQKDDRVFGANNDQAIILINDNKISFRGNPSAFYKKAW